MSQQMLMITAQLFSWTVNKEFEVTKECAFMNVYLKTTGKDIFELEKNTNSVQPEVEPAKKHYKWCR